MEFIHNLQIQILYAFLNSIVLGGMKYTGTAVVSFLYPHFLEQNGLFKSIYLSTNLYEQLKVQGSFKNDEIHWQIVSWRN